LKGKIDMGKKIVVISTSLRANSNSNILAEAFAKGAEDAGHEIAFISLRGKKIEFCRGCLACQRTGSCVIKDDVNEIAEMVLGAQVVAFATPIYYYEMSGQMKTLIDRMNSMYPKDYAFRDIYFLASAADDAPSTPDRAINGLKGWIDCFEKAEFKGSVFCGGVDNPGDAKGKAAVEQAYEMGRHI